MRVLLAASIYPPDPGGPALHAQAFYQWLDSKGYKPLLEALSHYRSKPSGIRHILYLFNLLKKADGCDVVYAYDALGAGIPALITSKVKKKKLIVRIGGDLAWERYASASSSPFSMNEWYERGMHGRSLYFLLSRWVIEHASVVIVPSPLLARLLRKQYGVEMKKIIIIANPIPEVPSLPTKTEQTIIFASRLVKYKNLDTLLVAVESLVKEGRGLKLSIIGDGPEKARLESLVQSLGIEQQVEFTGALTQKEVMARTSKCLITIAPALTEFNPNYVLQGISLGKPFIISSEHGLPFVIPEEYTFNARDKDVLEERIRSILAPTGYASAKDWLKSIPSPGRWDEVMRANWKAVESVNVTRP